MEMTIHSQCCLTKIVLVAVVPEWRTVATLSMIILDRLIWRALSIRRI